MAFDSTTRNKLQRMVGACRRLLADEFDDQLQGLYGIYAQDGRVLELEKLTSLDDDDHQAATLLRARINHLTSGMASEKQPLAEAVRRVLREQAFTLLNRFAALRMAEERGFVQECVGQGLKSKGFQVFETVARSGLGGAYERYITFIHGMFDELSLDLGVLFDRWSPFGLLFPREPALLKFFDLLNDSELKPLWKEDETIGWIYQYFNDEAERKKMREESSAPRNSRELAVRNQFFTPRYVVEFLTDNTLGRIWYEMTRGETKLKEQCRYLVRRPNEIFLKPGENPPATITPSAANVSPSPPSEGGEGRGEVGAPSTAPTQEELLRQPVHIPHRPLKDPRTILMLDPACGSMHFGLYAFDLFEVIYDEAWEMAERMKDELRIMKGEDGWQSEARTRYPRFSSFIIHTSSFPSREAFLKAVPAMIIEHNLHGIDIDPRCAQIAGLSLWLRAQKAWQRLGLKPAERPAIKRSNIVCAEPMPGEKELLREFVEREFPAEERGVCLRLLEAIFDKMQLAGEAGSLLKIEEEIRSAIEDARRQWQTARQRPEFFDADQLAALDTRAGAQQEVPAAERASMAADLRSLTSEDFWERIEERIYAALRDYAEQAENGSGFQRRLFAEDAARGFAFIDVCRKRYDVALMNPPFGESAHAAKEFLARRFPRSKQDIYAAFVECWLEMLGPLGLLGAITSRTGFFLSSFRQWREEVVLKIAPPVVVADLGFGVLDGAMVETTAYCLSRHSQQSSVFFRLLMDADKDACLGEAIDTMRGSDRNHRSFLADYTQFEQLPNSPFAYWITKHIADQFSNLPNLEADGRIVRVSNETGDDFRFMRLWPEVWSHEVGRKRFWVPHAKGGPYRHFSYDLHLLVAWDDQRRTVRGYCGRPARPDERVACSDLFFRRGLTYPRRTNRFSLRVLPAGSVFSNKGAAILVEDDDPKLLLSLLALMNSYPFVALLQMQSAAASLAQSFEVGLLQKTPIPELSHDQLETLARLGQEGFRISLTCDLVDEFTHFFVSPGLLMTRTKRKDIRECFSELDSVTRAARKGLDSCQQKLGDVVSALYDFSEADQQAIADSLHTVVASDATEDDGDEDKSELMITAEVGMVISYVLGVAFGRWDIRYATGEQAAPELPDPFAPLPVCPPGQLQNAQGLPVSPEDMPAAYPVRIPWDGILVDDPNHPLDIECRAREVIALIWKDEVGVMSYEGNGGAAGASGIHNSSLIPHNFKAEAIEAEACQILGVKSLRDYFRKPAGFFADHLKRYSKSRRQAPIYWPLATASGSYTLWIYYHRLSDQTLFQCVNDFVKPKLEEVNRDIERLQRPEVRDQKSAREKLEALQDFSAELKEFHDELLRVAGLPYKPDLNDGVLITASPLWKLFRLPKWQKDLKACWESLESGEYDWAHMAYTIWPNRVKKVCKTDRSIAIAHGLEELCEVKAPEKKAKRGKKKADAELELD
jgi:hypothetical protein